MPDSPRWRLGGTLGWRGNAGTQSAGPNSQDSFKVKIALVLGGPFEEPWALAMHEASRSHSNLPLIGSG